MIPFFSICQCAHGEYFFPKGSTYFPGNNYWGSTYFPGNKYWGSTYFRGVLIFCYTGKKFVISRVRYIERLFKGLIRQEEQTFVRYIESSYYREFLLSSVYCTLKPEILSKY